MTETTFTVTRDQLTSIASLAYCASSDDVSPVITGVHVTIDSAGSITATATDRYIAAELTMQATDFTVADTVEALMPGKWLLSAAKSVKGGASGGRLPAIVTVTHTDEGAADSVSITNYDITVKSQLLSGNYPSVARLFPDNVPETVDNFLGYNLNPHKLMQIAKVIPAGMSSRELKSSPILMRVGNEERPSKSPVIVTRHRVEGFRAMIMPNLILS